MRSIEIPQPADRDWKYKAFEKLPGILSLLILALPVILGALNPKLAAYFIIAFLLTWFVYIMGIDYRALLGWRIMNRYRKLPWQKMNQDLEALSAKTASAPSWHAKNIARVEKNIGSSRMKPSEIYHVIMIAFWNESREILEPTIRSVLASDYDHKKIILYLAYEERGGPEVEKTALGLIKDYGDKFFYAKAVKHTLVEGEIPGKGANITCAGRVLGKDIREKGIDPLKVLVTTLDSDNRPDPQYVAALTYTYCSTEDPLHASYQPIPMFLNNIWDAPAPMRVIATGNSFWNIMLATRPHMLRNFSSHAQPLAALIDTDYWSVRTVVEDGHQFWRTYFRYDGNHHVYPIYLPIYQDAVLTDSYKTTLKAQFYQVRRWAYGASDIAYVANQGFLKKNNIPKYQVFGKFFRLLQNHVGWATMSLVLLFSAYPTLFFNPQSFVANQLPHYSKAFQTIGMVGIGASLLVSLKSLPPKPAKYKRHRTIWMVLQWGFFPITTIVYGSFAAINSQTRLIFGRYLGKFDLTEKAIKSERTDVTSM